jgi:tRNA dimethylallyltransferase
MAVYKGMDIGTAKPTPEEKEFAPFHMIDLVEPDEPFTVVDFQERAVKVVDEVMERGRLPLVVGGTGLYVRAVVDGLNIPGPGPDPEFRARMEKLALEKGNIHLHKELARVDTITAARLHPNDVKRIVRALEVYKQTGHPMSEVVEQTQPAAPRYPDTVMLGLTMDRERLYRRIEARVDDLIRTGLIDEVKGLLDRGYDTDLPAMQGLGYKEIAGYLKGSYDLESAVNQLKRDTRRFAKRQFTWFRADKRIDWIEIDELSPAEVADELESRLSQAGVV